MDILYCPWRQKYVQGVHEAYAKKETAMADECVFCVQFNQTLDEQHFILRRFKYCAVMLNRFPYNSGHLLILPFTHIAKLSDLPREARYEIMDLSSLCCEILEKELDAHGINVGLNLGKAAGAGIPTHLHQHVLPRWFGDTNFLPTLAHTKQISIDLREIYDRLKKHIILV